MIFRSFFETTYSHAIKNDIPKMGCSERLYVDVRALKIAKMQGS